MKRIIITGGSDGLGFELSKILKGEIHILDIKPPKQKLENVTYHKVDLTKKELITTLKKIKETDILINNAGIMNRESLTNITLKDFNKITNTNITASFTASRYANLKKDATIIFINSRHGTTLKNTAYSYTKNCLKLIAKTFSKKYNVKEAYLGPFEGGASKTGHTPKEYEKRYKEKTQTIAKLIKKLIKTNHTKIIYQEKTKTHQFK